MCYSSDSRRGLNEVIARFLGLGEDLRERFMQNGYGRGLGEDLSEGLGEELSEVLGEDVSECPRRGVSECFKQKCLGARRDENET